MAFDTTPRCSGVVIPRPPEKEIDAAMRAVPNALFMEAVGYTGHWGDYPYQWLVAATMESGHYEPAVRWAIHLLVVRGSLSVTDEGKITGLSSARLWDEWPKLEDPNSEQRSTDESSPQISLNDTPDAVQAAESIDESITPTQRRILDIIRKRGCRMTTREILSELEKVEGAASEGVVKQMLAELVRRRILDNRQDVRPRGYGFPRRSDDSTNSG
jgi:hypothetical protein